MSMAEYVEEFNDLAQDALRQYEQFAATPEGQVLTIERDQLGDFTPQDLKVGLERIGQVERNIMASANEIDPPDEVEEFHALYFALSPFTAAREALAVRAGVAADWEELSATPEMEAYRSAVAADKQACTEFAAAMDGGESDGLFGDLAWVPSELADAVSDVFACAAYPDHPEDLYRPLASAP